LASDETGMFRLRTPQLPLSINGAGDAIAALFFAHFLRAGNVAEALACAASSIFGILSKTVEVGSPEIQIVAAQEEIVNPSRMFEAEPLEDAGA
jgi:pyridoxine kinase